MEPVTMIGICSAMLIAGITEKGRRSTLQRNPQPQLEVKDEKIQIVMRKRPQRHTRSTLRKNVTHKR